jgi:hypothetical protein
MSVAKQYVNKNLKLKEEKPLPIIVGVLALTIVSGVIALGIFLLRLG